MIRRRGREYRKTARGEYSLVDGVLADDVVVANIAFLAQPHQRTEAGEVAVAVHPEFVGLFRPAHVFDENRMPSREHRVKLDQHLRAVLEEVVDVDIGHCR